MKGVFIPGAEITPSGDVEFPGVRGKMLIPGLAVQPMPATLLKFEIGVNSYGEDFNEVFWRHMAHGLIGTLVDRLSSNFKRKRKPPEFAPFVQTQYILSIEIIVPEVKKEKAALSSGPESTSLLAG